MLEDDDDPDAASDFLCPRCGSDQTCLFDGGLRTCLNCEHEWV